MAKATLKKINATLEEEEETAKEDRAFYHSVFDRGLDLLVPRRDDD